MADYTVVPANVLPSANATIKTGVAGVDITQGQVLYKDTANANVMKLSDANSGTPLARSVTGIAVNAAKAGQPVDYITKDPSFKPGYTLVADEIVILASDNAGASAPSTDAVSGDYVTVLGIGIGTNLMNCPGFTMSSTVVKP